MEDFHERHEQVLQKQIDGDIVGACRIAENLYAVLRQKEISLRSETNDENLVWKQNKIMCTRTLAQLYYELKLFRNMVPLLEGFVWKVELSNEIVCFHKNKLGMKVT